MKDATVTYELEIEMPPPVSAAAVGDIKPEVQVQVHRTPVYDIVSEDR